MAGCCRSCFCLLLQSQLSKKDTLSSPEPRKCFCMYHSGVSVGAMLFHGHRSESWCLLRRPVSWSVTVPQAASIIVAP